MLLIADIIIFFIAILHISFLVLEMFFWDKPVGLRLFGQSIENAKKSKILASNQGLYNGFLAVGLFWGIMLGADGISIKFFFLSCIIVAGIFGSITVNIKILFVQALPAIIALILILIS
jgi:putative membrane protein